MQRHIRSTTCSKSRNVPRRVNKQIPRCFSGEFRKFCQKSVRFREPPRYSQLTKATTAVYSPVAISFPRKALGRLEKAPVSGPLAVLAFLTTPRARSGVRSRRAVERWRLRADQGRREGRRRIQASIQDRVAAVRKFTLSRRKLIHRARIPPVISVQAERRYKSSSSFLARPILRVRRPPPTTVNSLPKSWLQNLVRTDSFTIVDTMDPTPSLNPTSVSSAINQHNQTIAPVPPPAMVPCHWHSEQITWVVCEGSSRGHTVLGT